MDSSTHEAGAAADIAGLHAQYGQVGLQQSDGSLSVRALSKLGTLCENAGHLRSQRTSTKNTVSSILTMVEVFLFLFSCAAVQLCFATQRIS